jgi:hypothetical protein
MAKEKIRLVATSITFTSQSIVYGVEFDLDSKKGYSGISVSLPNIKHKDLIMKTTFVDQNNMELIFTPIHVTPHFYQAIHKKLLRNITEYEVEMTRIYAVGEVVGYVIG